MYSTWCMDHLQIRPNGHMSNVTCKCSQGIGRNLFQQQYAGKCGASQACEGYALVQVLVLVGWHLLE